MESAMYEMVERLSQRVADLEVWRDEQVRQSGESRHNRQKLPEEQAAGLMALPARLRDLEAWRGKQSIDMADVRRRLDELDSAIRRLQYRVDETQASIHSD